MRMQRLRPRIRHIYTYSCDVTLATMDIDAARGLQHMSMHACIHRHGCICMQIYIDPIESIVVIARSIAIYGNMLQKIVTQLKSVCVH